MPDTKAIERGLKYEDHVANVLGGEKQIGSGNKFYSPSDVRAHGLLISCKSEINYTLAAARRHLDESIDLAHGTGEIPALAFEYKPMADKDDLVLIRLADLVKAFSDKIVFPKSPPNGGLEKRSTADIPLLLR